MGDELTDQEFGHQVLVGATVGVLVTFVIMALGVVVFAAAGDAVPAMAWAALVGGGFFGGSFTVTLAMGRADKAEKAARAARAAQTGSGTTTHEAA